MIERITDQDGKQASVVYMDANYEPADKSNFDYARIYYDDGRVVLIAHGLRIRDFNDYDPET